MPKFPAPCPESIVSCAGPEGPRPPRRAARAAAFAALALCTSARADCIDDAALLHQVNAHVLRAIGWQESRLQPGAIGHNRDGSVDLGAFQINSIHLARLARHGVDAHALADGCVSAYVAAWHYRHQVELLGNSWAAVGAYHSRTPARAAWYANQIAGVLMRWNVMPPGPPPFAPGRMRPDGGRSRTSHPVPPAAAPTPRRQRPPGTGSFGTLTWLPPAH